jgi:hypothetical protein
MKSLFLTSISLLAMAACTPQAPPSSPQGTVSSPTTVGGSAYNTTSTFDGAYQGCQPFTVPPIMTITNGLAQFQAAGAIFAGYVTLQGSLTMDTGRGAMVTGNFDPQTLYLEVKRTA